MALKNSDFKKVSVSASDLLASLASEVAGRHRLRVVVKWTKGRPLTVFALHVRRGATTAWTNLLTHVLADNDGDITQDIGDDYTDGAIKLRVGLFAMADVPKCAVFLVQDSHWVTQLAPAPAQTMKLERTVEWFEVLDYQVRDSL